jgi:hypothetical protein
MSHAFLRRLRRYVAALPPLVFGFMGSPAFSDTIDASDFSVGQTQAVMQGVTVNATGGSFTKIQSVGNGSANVVGISTGFVPWESDSDGEQFTINFGGSGAIVSEITLGLLFREGEWNSAGDELVRLRTNTGDCSTLNCLLSADATFKDLTAGVSTLSNPVEGQGGIFRITNPFGSTVISQLELLASTNGGSGSEDSSFGLVSLVYNSPIPEPGTLVLVGLRALGLGLAGRRRALRA